MKYKLENGKEINIPDKELETNMKALDITLEEAIEMYLDDNDYTVNEEVEALTAKAKDAGIKIRGESEKPRAKRVVERKEDPTKEGIIEAFRQTLVNEVGAENVKVVNIGKIITFDFGGETYKVDLIRQRKPKAK